ncbi:MAG: hypothetical protein AAB590_00495 [Patescibacteria group bacterium]
MNRVQVTNKTIESILIELHLLRRELELLVPKEDLKSYSHPKRVLNSYEKALTQYPPVLSWR